MKDGVSATRASPRGSSAWLFVILSVLGISAMQAAHSFFPGDLPVARLGRLVCLAGGACLLIAGSRWLLRRDGLTADRLGLGVKAEHGRAFLFGASLAILHIAFLLAILYVAAPFEIVEGTKTFADVALASMDYFAGNLVEELLARGYLLIVLAHWLGTTRAIWMLAVPFGLFHFPGLDLVALIKMMLTTGAMHFVYSYSFLATRSLWAAVAAHAVGNTLLHAVIGVDKPGALALHFRQSFPESLDLPFVVFFGASAVFALWMSRWSATRRGAAWMAA